MLSRLGIEEVEERRDFPWVEGSREELLAVNWVSKGESDLLRWSPLSFEQSVGAWEVGVVVREM